MYDLGGDFRNSDKGLDAKDALYFLNECLNVNVKNEDRESDRKEYAKYWLDAMIAFVNSNPDETFFLLTDHEDEYYDQCQDYTTVDPLKG